MNLPFTEILGAALPVFILLAMGFGLRRTKVIRTEADSSIMKLIIRVFYPCLFLDFIIGNPAVKEASTLVAAPLIGFLTITGGFLIGYLVARLIGLKRGAGLRTFAFCSGIYNYGFIPIPLILVLFGSRETTGVLLVHNLGVEVAIWTVGILLLSGRLQKGFLRKLINPPIVALVTAILINATGLDTAMPVWLSRLISMLGACSIPIGILLSGASIADFVDRKILRDLHTVPLAAIAVRLGLLPMLFLLLAASLPMLPVELRQVMIIQAAMPAGIFPVVLARHFGGDAFVASKVVLVTTLASVLTMPLWIQFGIWWVL